MKKIGFIGLGNMGKPMALNLVKAGYSLTVYGRRPQPVKELVDAGATPASSPRELAEKSDVVITIVSSSPQVEEIVLGANGVLAGLRKGGTIIDMSTIDPAVTRKIAAVAAAKGIEMLDAPVSGGPLRAADGTLTIMVGGKKEALEKCRDILGVMGKKVFHVGDVGMGEVVKLANNVVGAVCAIGVCEGFLFGTRFGVDPKTLFEVLRNSSADCWFLRTRVPYPDVIPESPANSDFSPGFTTDLQIKDLDLVLSAAKAERMPLLACSLALQLLEAASASGLGQKDWSAVSKVIRRLGGEVV